jgi:hypothetical protein
MPSIDLGVDTTVSAEPSDIAAVMFDPAREPDWTPAVVSVEIIDKALAPGARVRHTARYLGREVTWMTAVEAVHFPHLLTLRVEGGPVAGTMSYQIQRAPAGGSVVRIEMRGEVPDLAFVPMSLVERELRSMLAKNLERLKGLVESASA